MTPASIPSTGLPSTTGIDPAAAGAAPQPMAGPADMALREIPPFFVTKPEGIKAEAGGDQLSLAVSSLIPAPNAASDPMQVLASQMALMQSMMSWEFASQVASKVDSGVQSLFNSQV